MEGIHSLWRPTTHERAGPKRTGDQTIDGVLLRLGPTGLASFSAWARNMTSHVRWYLWRPGKPSRLCGRASHTDSRDRSRKIGIGGCAPAQLRVTIRSAFLVLRFRK